MEVRRQKRECIDCYYHIQPGGGDGNARFGGIRGPAPRLWLRECEGEGAELIVSSGSTALGLSLSSRGEFRSVALEPLRRCPSGCSRKVCTLCREVKLPVLPTRVCENAESRFWISLIQSLWSSESAR